MIRYSKAEKWVMAFVAASAIFLPAPSFADDDGSAQTSGSTRIQIQRKDPLQARASVDHDLGALNNDEAAKLRAVFAQQAEGGRPQMYRGNAAQSGQPAQEDSNFRGRTPMLDRILGGQANQNQLRGMAQDQGSDNAPFIWAQSTQGGYYDATNTFKGVVPGYRLKELGGKFVDGTPVPRGNVKMNQAGHVWWQNDLSRNFKTFH
jgi:hypothetical protein